jgi:hypothetical protein
MLAKGLIAALVLTSTASVEAEPQKPLFEVEAIHDLNGDLEGQASSWLQDLGHPQIFTA